MILYDNMCINGQRAMAKSYAKINLTLDVLGKMENGYHEVKMVMQTISLFDLIIVDKTDKHIYVSTNLRYLPANNKNIAYKAAELFFKRSKIRGGAKIMIHKNIPVSAGLAGGSGNGGAVLCALNRLYNMPFSDKELLKMGKELGADVPYCMVGGTQLCEGIGERLTPIAPMPKSAILLVKPPVNVSTALIYEAIDSHEIKQKPDTDKLERALKEQDIKGVAHSLCNVMEPVTCKMHPMIGGIKEKMIRNGAMGAVMSGSGPTVFGIFDDYKKAKKSADSFYKQYKDVFLVGTIG